MPSIKDKANNEINYKKLFAIQKKLENTLKIACPSINHKSGIYFLTRVDEDGKYCYIGKAKDLAKRMVSHLQGYTQRIDISLRKRGFYSIDNESGWHLNVMFFFEGELDKQEAYYIKMYKNAGYNLYNIESGGTTGKTDINARLPSRNYHDGLKQARKTLKKELNHIINNYLIISLKKNNIRSQKALEKFYRLLSEEETENSESANDENSIENKNS